MTVTGNLDCLARREYKSWLRKFATSWSLGRTVCLTIVDNVHFVRAERGIHVQYR